MNYEESYARAKYKEASKPYKNHASKQPTTLSLGTVGCCRVLLGTIGCCWVLLGTNGCCWVLMGYWLPEPKIGV